MTATAGKRVVRLETVAGPKQERSERTLYRLLDAAEALIAEKGLAEVSIPEIVRRARSSVGGFYARFRDKNELLRALEERFYRELSARLDDLVDERRWRGAPTEAIVRALVAELVQVTRERRPLLAAFLARAVQDPFLREDSLRFRRRVTEQVRHLLATRSAEMSHPDPELAIDLGVQAAFAIMQEHLLLGETRVAGRRMSDALLERELTRLFLGYIGLAGASPSRARGGPRPHANGRPAARPHRRKSPPDRGRTER